MTPLMVEHDLRTALALIRGATCLMANPHTTQAQWDAASDLLAQGLDRLSKVPGLDHDFWERCDLENLAPLPPTPLAEAI